MLRHPKTPTTSPLEDNPNLWQPNTGTTPFFKAKQPVEVQYADGQRRVIKLPQHYVHEAGSVCFWRPHVITERMEYFIKFEWFRKFSIWDRIRILFGHNIVVPIAVACRHSPGVCQPVAIGYVTTAVKVEDYMQDQLKQALARYTKRQAKHVE